LAGAEPGLETVAVLAVVLAASLVQTLLGFGFALVAVPLLMGVIGVRDTVILVPLTSIVNTALVAGSAWRTIAWPRVGRMLLGCVVGLPCGLAALLWASEATLRGAVGLVTVLLTAALAAGVRLGPATRARDLGVGFAVGALGTSAGMNGPPAVLYLQGLGIPPAAFRAELAVLFTVTSALAILTFAAGGVLGARTMWLALAGLPAVVVGNRLGTHLFGRIDAVRFRRLVLAVLVVTGLGAAASAFR
jgi:hypothetical protein